MPPSNIAPFVAVGVGVAVGVFDLVAVLVVMVALHCKFWLHASTQDWLIPVGSALQAVKQVVHAADPGPVVCPATDATAVRTKDATTVVSFMMNV